MGELTLGSGDSFNIGSIIVMGYEEEIAEKNYEHLISNESEGVAFHISINYINELNESQKYRIWMEDKIHNDRALLIKSESLVSPMMIE